MSVYLVTQETSSEKKILADDMFLTLGLPTTAGSKMLQGYQSLLESEALTRLKNAGYALGGKTNVGEFAIDLLGETSHFGSVYENGVLKNPTACAVSQGDALAALTMDVNGAPRRAAAQSGLCALKPTYGTVSRYGTVPVACSGETVSVLGQTVADCMEVFGVIAGYDKKDGTSLPAATVQEKKAALVRKNKVAVLADFLESADQDVKAKIETAIGTLQAQGITVERVESKQLLLARNAWNILMSAELCNNVSRYDGVKYGYRSETYTNIDELYTNSRTEAFGDLLKKTILFGSETLSSENYQKVYDKALRVRRVICETFAALFVTYDAVLLPACSSMEYKQERVEAEGDLPFTENLYTAPASVSGLPCIVAGGVQLIGAPCGEEALATLAQICEKEGK